LKNSLEERIRERKFLLRSVADAQPELKREIERTTNKRRKAKKPERGWNPPERRPPRLARNGAKSRGTLKTGSGLKRSFP